MKIGAIKKLFLFLVLGFMASVAAAVPLTMDQGEPYAGNPDYVVGFGGGRALGFHADENFSISTYAIDISVPVGETTLDYEIELFSSPDGLAVGAFLASSTAFNLVQADGYQDIPFSFDFIAGNYYIINFSRVDKTYSSLSARYLEENHLPYDYGVLTLIDGLAGGTPGPNAALVHARFDGGNEATYYSVGGSVSGLTGTGLALQNNVGDTLAVAAAATAFTFATELPDLATYAVTVSTQPTGQTCSVTGGDNNLGGGAIAGADVTSVIVTCVDDVIPTYSVGGTVSGLTGTGLALQNNTADTLAVAAAATAFTFATELLDLATYAVTVSTQPTGQTCTVTDGSGTIATADVTNVAVTCEDDVVPPMPATPVPTTSQWALIMLSMLIGLMVFANRRRLF